MRIPALRLPLVLMAVALGTIPLHGQSTPEITAAKLADSVRVTVEAAVATGDDASAEAAVALAERALALHASDALLRHYHAYALYRAGTMVYGRSGSGKARPYFDKARDILERLIDQPTIPESYALLASVYGMQIATAKVGMVAGMRLGPKATSMMERAAEAGPTNPRVWTMRGISALNTPGAFGGGLGKAESHLKRALELFATDKPEPPLPAWGLADAHIWLGQVYAKQKKRDAARAEFEQARALQPHNAWITMSLLPSLDKIP